VTAEADDLQAMGKSHFRGSTLLVGGRVLAIVFTLATQVVLVRALTREEYGSFAFALAIASASQRLISLGTGQALSRFVAIYEEERDYPRLFGSIAVAVTTVLAGTAVLVAVVLAFSDALIGELSEQPDARTVLLLMVALAPLEALDTLLVNLFAVFSKARAIFVRKYLVAPGLRLLVVLALALLGQDVVFLAIGYVATGLVGILIYAGLLVPVLRERRLLEHLRWRQFRWPVRTVLAFSGAMLTADLVYLAMNTVSVMILAQTHGASDVAGFRAVFSPARLNQFVFAGFLVLFLPLASRMFSRGDVDGLRQAYWRNALMLAVFSFPVFAMTGVFSQTTTVTLFGDVYADAAPVLTLLAVGYYVNVAFGFNAATLQVFGRLRYVVCANVGVAALNVGLGFLLIPRYGMLGVGVASCAALVCQNLAMQVGLRSTISTALVDRAYVIPYALVAAAVAVLVGLRWLLEPGFVLSVLLAGTATLLLVWLTRRRLELADTFPELQRVPVLRRFVA